MFQGYFKRVSKKFQGNFTGISRMFQVSLKGVSSSFKGVSRIFERILRTQY